MKRTMLILVLLISSLTLVWGQTSSIVKQVSKTGALTSMAEVQSDKLDFTNVTSSPEVVTEISESPQITETPKDGTRAARTASVTGNWNSTATWGGLSVPVDGDAVTINAGITVTVTAAAACTSITFASTGTTALTISGTNTLTVSGAVVMPRPNAGFTTTINVNAGTMTIGTTLTMSATTSTRNDIINITTGSLTIAGTTTAGTTGCIINFTGAGSLTFTGALTGSPAITTYSGCNLNIGWTGTLTAAQSTAITLVAGSNLNYTGAGAQTIYARTYAGNMGLSGTGTKTIAASTTVTVSGNLTNNSTLVLTLGTSTTTTYLIMGGNLTNNGTITATAAYTLVYFLGTAAQQFTNNATITAPLNTLALGNSAGLTLLGSNQITCQRVNLYYGTITNSNKINLGNGGTTYGVVQIGTSTSYPRGNFDQAPTFNAGDGGYQILYAPASVDYSTSYEVPTDGNVAYFSMVSTPRTVSLNRNITVPYVYATGLNLGSGNLNLGAYTLTIEGTVAVTSGTVTGGTSSNIIYSGETSSIMPAVVNGLANLTFDTSGIITMAGTVTVNTALTLTQGTVNNGTFLTMASGATINRSAGALVSPPALLGTVNLVYSGNVPITAGKELPTGTTAINNLTTNPGGFSQYAYSSSTSTILTEPFADLTSWTGNKAATPTNLMFAPSSTVLAGGTTPEVRFYSTEVTHSNITRAIYRGPINTSGKNAVNITFKTYATGNYTQDYPTYLKLQSSTSTSGPWNDVWSYAYASHAAANVSISNYANDVGGNMYLQFAFVGDPYALDYWDFDNLVVDGVTITPQASNITVNGTLNLAGNYTVGSGNTLTMANNTTINRSGGALSVAPTFAGTVNLTYSGATPIIAGKELPTGASVINNLATNAGGFTQYAYSTTTLLTEPFADLTSWTGNIGSGDGQFTAATSVYAGGTTPEARFTGSITTPFPHGDTTYYIYRTNPIDTAGLSSVNVSFKTMAAGDYLQNVPSYLKLQSATSTSGTWHDVWSMDYAAHAATNVFVPLHSTDVGGDIYFRFAFVGDFYCLDYWFIDNFVVDAVNTVASNAKVNGNLNLVGDYSIGSGNTLVISGATTGSGIIIGGTTANVSVTTGSSFTLPAVVNALTINNGSAVNLPSNITVGTLSIPTGSLNLNGNSLSFSAAPHLVLPGTGVVTSLSATETENALLFPDRVKREWTISGAISSSLYATFTWTSDDDEDYNWSGMTPVAYQGLVQLNTISYGTRTITVEITSVSSKDGFTVGVDGGTLPVVLSSFSATTNAQNNVSILWTTQSETNLTGFYVYRSNNDELSDAMQISALINSTNTSQQQRYLFTDITLVNEGIYYYWLQIAEMDGSNVFYGPIAFNYTDISNPGTPGIPLVTELKSVYPNPFNPSTTIGYGLAKAADVTITVYNSRGQIVRTFNEGMKSANNYRLNWNGKDNSGKTCTTGVYYVKMQAGKDSFTRKAVLMK
ncbi:MAG: hypothetical protein CVU50_02620 [Candidatus Cloacimonetes bacterium HGW-Cloacimonetes-3]|jgi:hypothetical protein|nr:MAG: hypothetical protein CVU50_02620 [Candidatus Cloacimonetes bacterium HGW-Cloacimonetes-3]